MTTPPRQPQFRRYDYTLGADGLGSYIVREYSTDGEDMAYEDHAAIVAELVGALGALLNATSTRRLYGSDAITSEEWLAQLRLRSDDAYDILNKHTPSREEQGHG